MRKLLIITMSFVMLTLISIGCVNTRESGSAITLAEAEAGLAEFNNNMGKAFAARKLNLTETA
ncbi:MAG: hypothetical protein U5P10_00040 [Spirochaetia bacterium]|nr:hypothetical protein [Spirochaetia bacterium]